MDGRDGADADAGKEEPRMYRWISGVAGITLSVPAVLLPVTVDAMDVDGDETAGKVSAATRKTGALCDVQNCGVARKYRLVGDWERGACGMGHLKVLEGKV